MGKLKDFMETPEYKESFKRYIENQIFWNNYWEKREEKAYSIMSQDFDFYMNKYINWINKLYDRKDWGDKRISSLVFLVAMRYGETIYEHGFARYILHDWYFMEPYMIPEKLNEEGILNIIEQDILENMVKLKVYK